MKHREYIHLAEDTLLLVHIIFRHGARTPEKGHIYPKDPYRDLSYHPIGYGQLTNKGKKQAYTLGENLRKRYGRFVGSEYIPGVLDAWSSGYDRAKTSLQLVLASLFPPSTKQTWSNVLDWQPIPFRYIDGNRDRLFLAGFYYQAAVQAYDEFVNGPEGREINNRYKDLYSYLSKHTGWEISSTREVLKIAATLKAEEDYGLELPSWTNSVWNKEIEEVAAMDFSMLAGNMKLKSYTAGTLIRKILHDTSLKIQGQSDFKMHLYSGHDATLAVILQCLDLFPIHVPTYCSHVIIELHKINDVHGFKIFYKNYDELELLTIPNCESFCPFDKFLDIVQGIVDENIKNDDRIDQYK